MSTIKLPIDLFENGKVEIEIYKEVYVAFDDQRKQIVANIDLIDVENINEMSNDVFSVPAIILAADCAVDIRGVDLVVYVYLCYLTFLKNNEPINIKVGEIAEKTNIKKTQIKQSINNLLRVELIQCSDKSGYYLVPDLVFNHVSLVDALLNVN